MILTTPSFKRGTNWQTFFLCASSLCGFGEESLVFVHEHQNLSSLATVISNTMFQNANEIQLGLRTFVLYVEQRC